MNRDSVVFAGVWKDEDYREEIRIPAYITQPVEIQHLCWYCEVLDNQLLESTKFWYASDGVVYRGNARGWRRCCKHGRWICDSCSPDATKVVPGSEWHEAPPLPANWDWIDKIKASQIIDLGRINTRNGKEIRSEQMDERRAVFLAIRRDEWCTDEIRIVVRLHDHTTPDHLSWFCSLLEGEGLEEVSFRFQEKGDEYRGDSRGWRRLNEDKLRVYWKYSKDNPPEIDWHPAPPRPAGWHDLTIIEWHEWDPQEGWFLCYPVEEQTDKDVSGGET